MSRKHAKKDLNKTFCLRKLYLLNTVKLQSKMSFVDNNAKIKVKPNLNDKKRFKDIKKVELKQCSNFCN